MSGERRRLWLLRFLRRLFELLQRLRIDLLPRHFYSQIPDIRQLRTSHDWRRPYEMRGIAGAELATQLEFVQHCCPPELAPGSARPPIFEEACRRNGEVGYGPIEAQFLYCFTATVRPPRVIQVGAGVSTAVMLRAAAEHGLEILITCIDPFPTAFISELAAAGKIELITEPAESLPPERLADLDAGSLLFVDSTHAVRPGSDVNRIILGAMPLLAKGVLVHFHDIVFPYDYMPNLLRDDLFFWAESPLLQAFLTDNRRVDLRVSLSMLHHLASDRLRDLLPSYDPASHADGLATGTLNREGHHPSSAYLEVTADLPRP